MAVLHRPPLLIADEPTSALDVITQSEILELFSALSRKMGTAFLYISHDLLSVAKISQRAAVMEQGRIVECRNTAELFGSPAHSYARKLISALAGSSAVGGCGGQRGPAALHQKWSLTMTLSA
jgi:peptide/nickel transport system ATP-binding protein